MITLPPLHIEGLITAAPFVELEGISYIQASSGHIAVIEYSGRGWISGKKNTFKARIYRDAYASASKEKCLGDYSGSWSGSHILVKVLLLQLQNDVFLRCKQNPNSSFAGEAHRRTT